MNEHLLILASYISIGMIYVLVFWIYRDYCLDNFRQRIFKLRDEFFDEAAEGGLDFQAPAYGMIRNTMNGMLRFGHRLGLPQLLLTSGAINRYTEYKNITPFRKRLKDNLSALDKDQRELVLDYYREMNFILVRHLLLSSPVLLLTVIVPLALTIKAHESVMRAVKILKTPLDRLDLMALTEGEAC